MKWIGWLLMRLGFERYDIGRGDSSGDYLTRWVLFGKRTGDERKATGIRRWRVYLHCFHRSDLDTLHDHPWPFVSLILAGGYHERTSRGVRWYGPGRILRRPATWRHRVEIPAGRKAWTLVVTGPKVRSWGFWCPAGFRPHREADAALRQTGHVCGEDKR